MPAFSCPLCKASSGQLIHTQRELDFDPVSDLSELQERHTDYWCCGSCGTIAQWPLPNEAQMAAFYQTAPPYQQPEIVQIKEDIHLDRVQFLQQYVRAENPRVLDVAAGDGRFLQVLHRETGWSCSGVEPFHPGASVLNQGGVSLFCQSFDSFVLENPQYQNAFDVVTSMHTLEHLTQPRRFLEQLLGLLKPEGLLFLEVPSLERGAEVSLSTWGGWIFKGHLCHFPLQALVNTLQQLGGTVVEARHHLDFGYPTVQLWVQKVPVSVVAAASFLKQVHHESSLFHHALDCLESAIKKYQAPVIWGAGVDLHKLLVLNPQLFEGKGQIHLVDNSPRKQGKTLGGLLIQSPETVKAPACIIVTPYSQVIQLDILNTLKDLYPGVTCVTLFSQQQPARV